MKAQNWLLSGNTGTSATDFLGTTDASPLIFKTNATERLRISSTGNLLLGKTTDNGKILQVLGNVHFQTSSTNGFVVGNTPSAAQLVFDGTTATTTIVKLVSRNFSTSSNGSSMFTGAGDGSPTDQVLFRTGAYILSHQQPFLIKRGYPQWGSSLVVDDDGQTGAYPADYKIALFNLNGTNKASIDKEGGAQFSGVVRIGTTSAQASAKLEISSTTQGFLAPRMTTTEKSAIASPAAGLLVYDNTLNSYSFYNGTTWGSLGSGSTQWTPNGTDISYSAGGVGIGTSSIPATYKLAVGGNVIAEKVKVKLQASGWPDYVFTPSYRMLSLSEIETYIGTFGKLPEVPSAAEVAEKGIDLGDNQALLLKKIEELTLLLIEQKKRIDRLEEENISMKKNSGK